MSHKYYNPNKLFMSIIICSLFNNYLGIDPDFDAVNKPMFIDNLEDVANNKIEIKDIKNKDKQIWTPKRPYCL